MSFTKAKDLLTLARMSATRHRGVSLQTITQEFGVNERTAQRMIAALGDVFPSLSVKTHEDRRRWWKLQDTSLLGMQGIYEHELVALEMSIRRARREGVPHEAEALEAVRDRLVATLPSSKARSAEVDADAVLEARGYACRPGPRVNPSPKVASVIAAALKGPYRVTVWYQGARDPAPRERLVEPYGVVLGIRRYLIARDVAKDERLRQFRFDRIKDAAITLDWFAKDPDFDLEAYAAQSFGSYHHDAEYGRVVWRFRPDVAANAREFVFHPDQTLEDLEDGSLRVTFEASGWAEMAWHLIKWGDSVEVLEPVPLRDLIASVRNGEVIAPL